MKQKKILLTGVSGFIGKAVHLRMNKLNFLIRCISGKSIFRLQSEAPSLKTSINNSTNNKINWADLLSGVSCIIHCAAKAHIIKKTNQDSLFFFRKANVEVTYDLAKQAASFGVKRFIFLSSIGVNGLFTNKLNSFTIDDIPKPIGDYQISKFEAERALMELAKKTGLEVVIIRAPLVYGEGVKGNFLRLLDLIYKEIPLPFASVKNLRSFIGLENLIDFIIHCIDHPRAAGKIFLISDREDISTPDLIRKLSKIMGKSSRLFPIPVSIIRLISRLIGKSLEIDKLLGSLTVDSSFASEITGWRPLFSLDEGLKKMVNWYLKK